MDCYYLLINWTFILSKLKNELKTTNVNELKMQNERLRVELAKALMNDKKIIEAFDKRGVADYDG